MAQLKNAFGHKNVTTDVMNSFNYVDNFVRFVTEAYTVYLAMQLYSIDAILDQPSGSVPNAPFSVRKAYLEDVCKRVVDEVWSLLPGSEINKVLEGETDTELDTWCFCDDGNLPN